MVEGCGSQRLFSPVPFTVSYSFLRVQHSSLNGLAFPTSLAFLQTHTVHVIKEGALVQLCLTSATVAVLKAVIENQI